MLYERCDLPVEEAFFQGSISRLKTPCPIETKFDTCECLPNIWWEYKIHRDWLKARFHLPNTVELLLLCFHFFHFFVIISTARTTNVWVDFYDWWLKWRGLMHLKAPCGRVTTKFDWRIREIPIKNIQIVVSNPPARLNASNNFLTATNKERKISTITYKKSGSGNRSEISVLTQHDSKRPILMILRLKNVRKRTSLKNLNQWSDCNDWRRVLLRKFTAIKTPKCWSSEIRSIGPETSNSVQMEFLQ